MTIDDVLQHSMVMSISDIQLDQFYSNIAMITGSQIKPLHFSGFNLVKSQLYNSLGCGARNCTFGHLAMLKYAQMLNWPYIMIFEDDATFIDRKSADEFIKYINNIPISAGTIVFGYNKTTKVDKDINRHTDYFDGIHIHSDKDFNISGSHAYMVTYMGIQNRIQLLEYYGTADSYSLYISKKSFFNQVRSDFTNSIHSITA